MMKKSSMNTAPKGKMPPMRMANTGCMNQAWSGICLGIWLKRTGFLISSILNPKYEPKNAKGTEMPNHSKMSATMDKNGTAPEDPADQTKRLTKKKTANTN